MSRPSSAPGGPRLVLIGPPGAGKGTQARRLAAKLGIPHVDVGSLLRAEVRAGTPLGQEAERFLARGLLVPDELVNRLVERRLGALGPRRGFVVDGYPRSVAQAEALDRFLHREGLRLSAALHLRVPDEVVVDRLAGRIVCPDCGAVFHRTANPPRAGERCPACHTIIREVAPGVLQCEACGRPLRRRPDDQPEIVRRRLAIYHQEVKPILSYYRQQGLLRDVDGEGSEDEVFRRILAALGLADGPSRRA